MADDACHTPELPNSVQCKTIVSFTASSVVSSEAHNTFTLNGISYVRTFEHYNPKRVQAVL